LVGSGLVPTVCGLPCSSSSTCLRRMGGWRRLQHRPRSRSICLSLDLSTCAACRWSCWGWFPNQTSPASACHLQCWNQQMCTISPPAGSLWGAWACKGGDTHLKISLLFWRFNSSAFFVLQVIIHEVDAYILWVMHECSSETSTQSPEIKFNYTVLFFLFCNLLCFTKWFTKLENHFTRVNDICAAWFKFSFLFCWIKDLYQCLIHLCALILYQVQKLVWETCASRYGPIPLHQRSFNTSIL